MTPQQREYLDLIVTNMEFRMDEFEEKFAELKQDIEQVKVIIIFKTN